MARASDELVIAITKLDNLDQATIIHQAAPHVQVWAEPDGYYVITGPVEDPIRAAEIAQTLIDDPTRADNEDTRTKPTTTSHLN